MSGLANSGKCDACHFTKHHAHFSKCYTRGANGPGGKRYGPFLRRTCKPCVNLIKRERCYAKRVAGKPIAPDPSVTPCYVCRRVGMTRLLFEHTVDESNKTEAWPRGEPYHEPWMWACDGCNTKTLVCHQKETNLTAAVYRDSRFRGRPIEDVYAAVDAAAAAVSHWLDSNVNGGATPAT